MTVAELIAELQRHPPYKPVRVRMPSILIEDEAGDYYINVHEARAQEVSDIRNAGPWIAIEGRE